MKTINLAAPWSHHTIEVTTDYQPGTHEVPDEVHAAAVAAGVHTEAKEKANDRRAKAGAAGAADPAES